MNSRITSKLVAGIVAVVAMVSATVANAEDPAAPAVYSASQINTANQLLRDGQIEEAVDSYAQIQPTAEQSDPLSYNMAVAQYRSGNLEAASDLFRGVAQSADTHVAARGRYNLGNCHYASALQQAEQDKQSAIESLRQAIGHYRGSLSGNPDHSDARANIELASQLIRQLEEEIQQDQQKQQQQQQNEDQPQQQQNQEQQQQNENCSQCDNPQQSDDAQSSDSQNPESQDSESNDSQSQDSQASDSQDSESSNEQQDSSDDQQGEEDREQQSQTEAQQRNEESGDDDQSEGSEQNEDRGEAAENSGQPQDSRDQQSHAGESPQSESQELPGQQQMQPTSGAAEEPADEESDEENSAEPAAGELTTAGPQDNESLESYAVADPTAGDQPMTREEAMKMLQAVRDRDMLRRLQQERRERSRYRPVDRDW